jgi:hypothetical protein
MLTVNHDHVINPVRNCVRNTEETNGGATGNNRRHSHLPSETEECMSERVQKSGPYDYLM